MLFRLEAISYVNIDGLQPFLDPKRKYICLFFCNVAFEEFAIVVIFIERGIVIFGSLSGASRCISCISCMLIKKKRLKKWNFYS